MAPDEPAPAAGQADREKRAAALNSVVAALFLTGMKAVVGLMTGSLGILAEALHSGLDLAAAGMTLLAVRVSGRPPDRDHPYGHGKVENLSALAETMLLLATCGWIVWEAAGRLAFKSVHVEASVAAFAVMAISILVDVSRSRMLSRVARKHDSQALEADALHFATDVWSSAVVILGLACVALADRLGRPWLVHADALAALGVSAIVVWVSVRLGRRTITALVDGVPATLGDDLTAAVRVPGVVDVRRVRVRRAGADTFADVVLTVDRSATLAEAHAVANRAENAAKALLPRADVVVHVEPSDELDESAHGIIRRLAREHGLEAHDIRLTEVIGRRMLDMHLELDGREPVSAAHARATRFENALRAELSWLARIDTHLEPHGEAGGRPRPVDEPAVRRVIAEVARRQPLTCDTHDVEVVEEAGVTSIAFHCTVAGTASLDAAHRATDRLERDIRERLPSLGRVTIHVEPAETGGLGV